MRQNEPRSRLGTDAEAATPADSPQPLILSWLALYAATIGAQLVSLAFGRVDAATAFGSMLLPSLAFITLLTVPAITLGTFLGRRIALGAPLLGALLSRQPGSGARLLRHAALAVALGGSLGAPLLLVRLFTAPHLPPQLPAFGHRGVIGGLAVSLGAAVAEEVWFRLGLMTALVWCVARLLGHREARPTVVWPILCVTSIGFGVAHLPQLMSYGAGSPFAIGGTILGNSAVGIVYGWCYWRRSLLAAMVAHFSVDVVLHVLPALLG
ncbi:MAG: CPBP family intramembrane metalloprotease [Acidobacteria bacterium]|nr:MAG: CPBP family intramembrane metalloprotease [Acidobacteriota bacterium]REK06315.1 MAG: CPBP family intramembrane metalloprotease [Acidobacteriota bacterium]